MTGAPPAPPIERERTEGAADGTHAAVLACLRAAAPPQGALLDAPCGAGALAHAAAALGLEPHGVDAVRHPRLLLPDANLRLADLDQGVPFEDARFDVVLSVEGIEHLASPRAFVRELARVLKPGGLMVLSTPNVLSVRSRWRWLTRGHHRHFTPDAAGRFSSDHLHAVDYHLLHRLLDEAGLEIRKVACNKRVANLRDRLLAWVIRWASRRQPFREVLLSDELLFGQILVVAAEKRR
jgi:SAM-dependent methyltransferase